jgi:hypothetical protein
MAPKVKMTVNLEFRTSSAWFMLEFLALTLYFMILHSLKKEKNIKKLFLIQNGARWLPKLGFDIASTEVLFLK